MLLSSLFEEGCHIPKSFGNSLPSRTCVGGWFLLSVILTNGYLGLCITKLSSPLGSRSIDKFEDLTPYPSSFQKDGLDLNTFLRLYTTKIHYNGTLEWREFNPKEEFYVITPEVIRLLVQGDNWAHEILKLYYSPFLVLNYFVHKPLPKDILNLLDILVPMRIPVFGR